MTERLRRQTTDVDLDAGDVDLDDDHVGVGKTGRKARIDSDGYGCAWNAAAIAAVPGGLERIQDGGGPAGVGGGSTPSSSWARMNAGSISSGARSRASIGR